MGSTALQIWVPGRGQVSLKWVPVNWHAARGLERGGSGEEASRRRPPKQGGETGRATKWGLPLDLC